MQEIIAKNKINDTSKINDSRIKIVSKKQRLLPPKQGYLWFQKLDTRFKELEFHSPKISDPCYLIQPHLSQTMLVCRQYFKQFSIKLFFSLLSSSKYSEVGLHIQTETLVV